MKTLKCGKSCEKARELGRPREARVVPILRRSIVELLPDGLDVKADSHHGVVIENPASVEHERGFLHRRVDPRIVVPSGGAAYNTNF